MADHSASASYLGFDFQPLHALHILLESKGDDSFVRVEAEDDVVLGLEGEVEHRQLKLIQKNLSHKSDDFWRTLKVWLDFLDKKTAGVPYFVLIITSVVVEDDPISVLRNRKNFSVDSEEISSLLLVLNKEAKRVCDSRNNFSLGAKEKDEESSSPYSKRFKACEAFLKASDEVKKFLLSRSSIIESATHISELQVEIEKTLNIVAPRIRSRLSERLVGWWGVVVRKSLLQQRDRTIYRYEVLECVTDMLKELSQDGLIDDMLRLTPPSAIPVNVVNKRQHDLIDAPESILRRSAVTEWLAREQRSNWVKDNPSNHGIISDFDASLTQEWRWFFEEVCSGCPLDESKCKITGRQILDWSFGQAPSVVAPIREGWRNPNLVRGSYQILASQLKVGWHPSYREKLGEDKDASGE